MWLTRQLKNPFEETLDTIQTESGVSPYIHIPVSVQSKQSEVIVQTEIPGVDKKDITVEFHKGTLVISGKKESRVKREGSDYLYSEVRSGSFKRDIVVGDDVLFDQAKAVFSDGVLSISLPKKESSQPQRIAIQ